MRQLRTVNARNIDGSDNISRPGLPSRKNETCEVSESNTIAKHSKRAREVNNARRLRTLKVTLMQVAASRLHAARKYSAECFQMAHMLIQQR